MLLDRGELVVVIDLAVFFVDDLSVAKMKEHVKRYASEDMRLLYDTIITVKRRCGPGIWHPARCMRGGTYDGARFCSCPGMLTVREVTRDRMPPS